MVKVKIIGPATPAGSDLVCAAPVGWPTRATGEAIRLGLRPHQVAGQQDAPVRTKILGWWCYRGVVVAIEPPEATSVSEIVVRIKHVVLRQEKLLNRITREVEAFENHTRLRSAPREPIPEDVRLFVWQRDRGRCVRCGGQRRLEFDHVIPVAEGGSSTARNIQLLCESCNRQKGKSI